MKKILFAIFIYTFFFIIGCTKQTISPTQAELAANELNKIINSNNIKHVIAEDYNSGVSVSSIQSNVGVSFSFSNGIISIDTSGSYNLTYLKKYIIVKVFITDPVTGKTTGTDNALILYFE